LLSPCEPTIRISLNNETLRDWHRDRIPKCGLARSQYGRADRAIDANSAHASSSLIFGDLIEDRLPRLLLLVITSEASVRAISAVLALLSPAAVRQ
jgi:hypothetical protein